jgi:uncharacterized protein YcaQ
MQLSKEQAQQIILHAQGLSGTDVFGKTIKGTLNTIQHLGYVQLDTLAVVARAHHHTLWTRNSSYGEKHLGQLLEEGKVFEYWSHAASYLPMDDFRFSLPRKAKYLSGHAHWFSKNRKLMKFVLDRIRAEGPLQSKDFETDRKRGSWFDWKPAKIALEQLFMEGSLMVKSRKGFQKVYDLTERVVPASVNQSKPTTDENAKYLVQFNLRALGIATMKDFTHLRTDLSPAIAKTVARMLKDGELIACTIDGIKEPYYILPETKINPKISAAKPVHIFSPFDNLVIRRERISKIFDWTYNLECYLPEHKRKFGYFCLPVMHDGKFAGMFDPKADRATGIFHVKKMYVEKHATSPGFGKAFLTRLDEFARYNGCEKVVIDKTVSVAMRKLLKY